MDDLRQPHPTDVIVGSRVRAARLACGMSQTALAEAIGVTFQQVQKYENGSNRISASKLVEVATTLRVSAATFLAGLGYDAGAGGTAGDQPPEATDLMMMFVRLPPHLRRAVVDLTKSLSSGAKE